jgi:hypothetical protein
MTINTKTTMPDQPSPCPQDKAFRLSAGFNLPVKNGKRLTVTFNAAVTIGDKPGG